MAQPIDPHYAAKEDESVQPSFREDGPRIFISAAEPSGDLHGASLMRATKKIRPDLRFIGVAGPRMVEAGCEAAFDMTRHSAMLLGAVKVAGRAAAMMSACDHLLRMHHFDAAVVIDSPTLHLPLAGRANALGIPVLYYIAPQMWAWGAYRIYKLRHRVDRAAVILPFEESYFRDQGVNATFVGHPLVDAMAGRRMDASTVERIRKGAESVVALLPGSRKHVVRTMLPDQLEAAARIVAERPGTRVGVSVANDEVAPIVSDLVSRSCLPVQPHHEGRSELIGAADLVLVASGTSTLEVALHERPMIVMYQSSPLFYHLVARWMIRTPFYSLPNILAGRSIVPEFMPYYRSVEPIARCALSLLDSPETLRRMTAELSDVVRPLRGMNASSRTAEMLLEMIGASTAKKEHRH